MIQSLRPYQIAAISGIRKAFSDGARSVLLVLPCGLGKTTIAAHFFMGLNAKGNRGLFVVHRRELTEQARERMAQHNLPFGTIESGHRSDFSKPIQVCSIMSLLSHIYPKDPETAPDPVKAEFIIVDEAHRSEAKSYKRVRTHYNEARTLGVTATPVRGDSRPLGDSYEVMVEVITVADAIDEAWLSDYRIYEGDYDAPDDNLSMIGDDFDQAEAARRIDTDKLVGDVYVNWKRRADGKRTIIFAQSQKHGMHLLSVFREAGEDFHYIDYRTPKEERGRITNWLRQGKIRGVINLSIYGEGVDIPQVECIVMARMTASLSIWIQFTMRGMRPLYFKGLPLDTVEQRFRAMALESKKDGCIILDHGGNARHRFGGPDAPHEWSLDGRKKREQPIQPARTECPICFAGVSSRTRVCPDCGHEFAPAAPRAPLPDTADGMLVEANYKIRGSEKAEREKARILALSEKEQRTIERDRKRLEKQAAAEAKLRRIEEEKEFLRAALAKMRPGDINWKAPLTSFRRRFKDEKHPTGYFPGKQHGAEIKFKQVFDEDERKLKWTIVAFEFEGRRYGAPAAE